MTPTFNLRSAALLRVLAIAVIAVASVVLAVLALNLISSIRAEVKNLNGEVETLNAEVETLKTLNGRLVQARTRRFQEYCEEVFEKRDQGVSLRQLEHPALLRRSGLLFIDIESGGLEFHEISAADPTWSPDGTRIAFVDEGPPGCQDIFVWTLADNRIENVTDDHWFNSDPVWNPAKNSITFASNRTEPAEIFSISLSNSEITQHTAVSTALAYLDLEGYIRRSPSWSPNGKLLAHCYSEPYREYPDQFWGTVVVDTGEADEVWPATDVWLQRDGIHVCDVVWSPGGRYFAAALFDQGLVITNTDGSLLYHIEPDYGDTLYGCSFWPVTWTPRGDALAFIVSSCEVQTDNGLYLTAINMEGATCVRCRLVVRPQRIDLGPMVPKSGLSFSPDGGKLVLAVLAP